MLLALFTILVVEQVLDGWTTYQARKRGDVEDNNFIRRMLDEFGPYWGLVIPKAVAVAVGALLLWNQSYVGLAIVDALYASVLVNNFKVLYRKAP